MIFNVSGGGGAALNFRVVGGTEAPANPAKICIWVYTEVDITSWIFSAEEPSPAEPGMVWFKVAASSPVAFNVLKKNGVMVYPLSAEQYVDGAWVSVTAKTWQGSAWVEWLLSLYDSGALNEIYTNGTDALTVERKTISGNNNKRADPSVTYGAESITIVPGNSSYLDGGIVYFPKKVDLTEYESIVFEGSITVDDKSITSLYVWSEFGTYINSNVVASLASAGTLDISSLTGEHYIGFGIYGIGSEIVVDRVTCE